MNAVSWSRFQFGFTVTYHYLFPQLTMGLALLIVLFKALALRSDDERYHEAARFWGRIFGINFAVGVVTGIPLEFQFGTNWARLSAYSGGVIGLTLAMEGMFAFFAESAFLGLFLFGEKRLGPRGHMAAAIMMFLGSWLSGYFIIATNAFMQHPVGYAVGRGGSTGRADWSAPAPALQLSDFWAYLLNPWALWQYAHNMSAAVITASFVVAAVGAYWALMGLYSEHARRFLQVGVTTGFLFSLLQLFPTGDEHGKLVARHQPAALAGHGAIYLIWKTTGPVHARSRTVAGRAWIIVLVLGLLATFVTAQVQPRIYANLLARPWTWLLLVLIVGSLAMVFLSLRRARELPAFLASSLFIASLLGATAAGQFPELLVSTLDPANDLNIYNAVAGGLGLRIGLFWWSVAILLAIGYFTYLFRSFRGKVTPSDGHGY